MLVSIIVAVSENNVIGKDNDLVWHLPDDMKFFKEKTEKHHVLMGRRNFESIPEKYRPLKRRMNIVVSRSEFPDETDLRFVKSLQEGLKIALDNDEEELFIIGGGEIYRQSLSIADKIYLTRVHQAFEGDTYFPELDMKIWKEVSRKHHKKDDRHPVEFTFLEYVKK